MAYKLSWKNEGLYWHWKGHMDIHELIQSNGEAIGHPEFEQVKFIVWDATEVQSYEIDHTAVKMTSSFAISANQYNKNVKVALLVAPDDIELQTLVQTYLDLTVTAIPHARQKMFHDMSEAQQWIETD